MTLCQKSIPRYHHIFLFKKNKLKNTHLNIFFSLYNNTPKIISQFIASNLTIDMKPCEEFKPTISYKTRVIKLNSKIHIFERTVIVSERYSRQKTVIYNLWERDRQRRSLARKIKC